MLCPDRDEDQYCVISTHCMPLSGSESVLPELILPRGRCRLLFHLRKYGRVCLLQGCTGHSLRPYQLSGSKKEVLKIGLGVFLKSSLIFHFYYENYHIFQN